MKQHLHSQAMLAIFPIQEYFATDYEIVNPYADDERINNPAVFLIIGDTECILH